MPPTRAAAAAQVVTVTRVDEIRKLVYGLDGMAAPVSGSLLAESPVLRLKMRDFARQDVRARTAMGRGS